MWPFLVNNCRHEDSDFQTENITKFLANLSENNKVAMRHVFKVTEHITYKNQKWSLQKSKLCEFKIRVKVLYHHHGAVQNGQMVDSTKP